MIGKLTLYELGKLCPSKVTVLLFASLLILNIALSAYTSYEPPSDSDKYYENVYAIYESSPEFFFSEYERIKAEFDSLEPFATPSAAYGGGKYLDMSLFGRVYDTVTADAAYHEKISSIIKTAESICDDFRARGMGDSYVYRYHLRVIELYTYLNGSVKLDDRPVSGWDDYFAYSAGFFIVFILLTAVSVTVVTVDHACGFYPVASICKNGRAKTAVAKALAAVIAAAFTVCIFTAASFLAVGIASRGYSDMRNAAQACAALRLLPLRLDMLGAFFTDLALKLASAVVFTLLLLPVASAAKRAAPGVAFGIGIMMLSYAASAADEVKLGAWKFLNLWSAYSICRFAPKYRSVAIGQSAVGLAPVASVLAVCAAASAFALFCVIYSKSRVIGSRRISVPNLWRKGKKRAPQHPLSLLFWELYKQRAVYAALAALFIIKIFASAEYYKPQSSIYDSALKKYIAELGGEYTDEKSLYIESEYMKCEEITARFDDVRLDWWYGEISDETYNRLFGEYMEALTKTEALRYLSERSLYLRALRDERGITGSFIYDIGYYKYVSQGTDPILLLFAAVFCCRSYVYENAKTSLELINTRPKGRRPLFLCKVTSCILSSACAWAIFKATDLFFFLRAYELPDMSAPLQSIPRYGETALRLSISEYTFISLLFSLLGTVILSILCFDLGAIIKRAAAAYAAAAAAVAVPHLALEAGALAVGFIDLTALYDADRLYTLSPPHLPPPIYGACFFASALFAAAVLTAHLLKKAGRGCI